MSYKSEPTNLHIVLKRGMTRIKLGDNMSNENEWHKDIVSNFWNGVLKMVENNGGRLYEYSAWNRPSGE